jgi:hypothetical protein
MPGSGGMANDAHHGERGNRSAASQVWAHVADHGSDTAWRAGVTEVATGRNAP